MRRDRCRKQAGKGDQWQGENKEEDQAVKREDKGKIVKLETVDEIKRENKWFRL